jgi:peptide/nickel transport system permease protein
LTTKPVSLIALVVLLTLAFLAAFAPWIAPYDFLEIDWKNMLEGPTVAHPMGTDQVGRDLLSRLMHAGRISLAVAVGSEAVALAIGVPIGLTAGFYRGIVDTVLMRIIDGLLAFPSILLALVIAAIFSGRFFPVLLAIGITLVPGVARIVRAGTLREKGMEYVTACYAVGASAPRIALRHILPNTFPELMVQITLGMAVAILIEATLSFLGLGVQPPLSSWGTQLKIGYREIWNTP